MGSSGGHGLSIWLSKGEYQIYSRCKTNSHGCGSVIRFERWVQHLSPPLRLNTFARFIKNDIPPIDVWMVLHAYLLNPQSASPSLSGISSLICIFSTQDFCRRLHPPWIAQTSCDVRSFTSGLLFQCLGEQLHYLHPFVFACVD